jgi:peptidoglycan/LPS O-acetylase OafA/YrhL
MPVTQQHQNKFDMLRGLAAIAVLVPHVLTTYVERLIGSAHPVALVGGAVARHAVLVFFLLSGYLITCSIVANFERNGRIDVIEYLTARVARIYPPLIGAIFLVLFVWAIVHGLALPGSDRYGLPGDRYVVRDAFTFRLMDVPRALLMRNGMLDSDGPLWTLYIEFHLYLIAMFAAMGAIGGKRLWWGIIALSLVALGISANSSFPFFALVWIMGATVALAQQRIDRWTRVPVFSVAVVLLIILALAPKTFAAETERPWIGYGVQFSVCLVYAQLIFLEVGFAASPPKFLVKTGDFSYSLYVTHFPLLLLMLSLTQTWMGASLSRALLVSAASTLLALVAAFYFARFFENQRKFKPYVRRALETMLPIGNSGASVR